MKDYNHKSLLKYTVGYNERSDTYDLMTLGTDGEWFILGQYSTEEYAEEALQKLTGTAL